MGQPSVYNIYIYIYIYVYILGRRLIGISGSLIWSKSLMELIFKPCAEFQWSPEGPVSQIHSPHLHVGAPRIFSDLLRSVQMLKREWGAESNGKLPHLYIPSKSAAWVFEFAVEDLPLSRTAALVPDFAVKDLPLGRILMMMMMIFWFWLALYFEYKYLLRKVHFISIILTFKVSRELNCLSV